MINLKVIFNYKGELHHTGEYGEEGNDLPHRAIGFSDVEQWEGTGKLFTVDILTYNTFIGHWEAYNADE